jgi:hypothetical protein
VNKSITPPGWDAGLSQATSPVITDTHLYPWVEKKIGLSDLLKNTESDLVEIRTGTSRFKVGLSVTTPLLFSQQKNKKN